MSKITLEIPIVVGSNGKWCSMGGDSGPDWGLMADCIMHDGKDPAQSRRYVVHVTVEVPPDSYVETPDHVEAV